MSAWAGLTQLFRKELSQFHLVSKLCLGKRGKETRTKEIKKLKKEGNIREVGETQRYVGSYMTNLSILSPSSSQYVQ